MATTTKTGTELNEEEKYNEWKNREFKNVFFTDQYLLRREQMLKDLYAGSAPTIEENILSALLAARRPPHTLNMPAQSGVSDKTTLGLFGLFKHDKAKPGSQETVENQVKPTKNRS